MTLPRALKDAIESMVGTSCLHSLVEAREELSGRYRRIDGKQKMTTEIQRKSYLASRMPATYAALQKVFGFILEITPLPIKSILDLGAGPGTAMWVACEIFPDLEMVTLIEKDALLASIGAQLARFGEYESMHKAKWIENDLEKITHIIPHDCVVLSYSVGELAEENMERLIALSWESAQELLLVVEPGTPAGFERIRMIRKQLISLGAHIVAPCTHALSCPMTKGDWCHFSARLERSWLHRKIKGGTLSYEDEKFSYIAATKRVYSLPSGRILRQPTQHSGHLTVVQCTEKGVEHALFSKKMGAVYQQLRKADWGESVN